MTETKEVLSLDEAWPIYVHKWKEGSKLIKEGNALWKQITQLPGSIRVTTWLGISENCLEAAAKVQAGYAVRLEADQMWHDAILKAKGAKCRLTWSYDDAKEAYECGLSTGETFKP